MPRLPLLTWIGNAAAVLLGKHGEVTEQAHQAGCSRQAAYQHADKVHKAVEQAQQPGPSRAELIEENRRLKEQLADARRQLKQAVVLDKQKKRRLAGTTSAMGLSLGQIQVVFALLLAGAGKPPGRATLGRWVKQQAHKAGPVLEVLDRHTQPAAVDLCPDEIFFHGKPVLVGVEPFSMALLLCRRAQDRKGDTWQEALAPFTGLQYAAADQGKGLQAGLKRLARARAAGAPRLEVGLDVFHTEREARTVLGRDWRKLEACWHKAEQADEALDKAKDLRGKAARAQAAWRRAEWCWSLYEQRQAAWGRAKAALAIFRPDGRLNDRTWAEQEIAAACRGLPGPAWRKVRGMLRHEHALTFLDRLHRRLAVAEPRVALREALVRLWRLEHGPRTGLGVAAGVVQRVICARLAADWLESYARVAAVLGRVVRASSAVECVNSVLRMQQARHRGLGQAMLDLKRLYWNCRAFGCGKRRGKCPYQLLGVPLPTYDFWELLQRDPQQLEQELSTPRVAA
jgi:tetratricopeptide (TPR) repeat protein